MKKLVKINFLEKTSQPFWNTASKPSKNILESGKFSWWFLRRTFKFFSPGQKGKA